jgi:hypothetical protein
MLAKVRQVLGFQLTIAELIGIAVIVGTPYVLVGAIWTTTDTEHLRQLHGVDLVVSFLVSVVTWPVLLFPHVCMT